MRLPISSSSKDAIKRISLRISGESESMISERFSFWISLRIFAAESVSSIDTTADAFLRSISFKYAPASSSSRCSSASAIISAEQIRYSFFRS